MHALQKIWLASTRKKGIAMRKADLPNDAYLAIIHWIDPCMQRSVRPEKLDDAIELLYKQASLGWVVVRDSIVLVINSVTGETGDIEYDLTAIPKVLVKRIERIRRKK